MQHLFKGVTSGVACLLPMAVQATVRVDLSGYVYQVSGAAAATFNDSQTVQASFTFYPSDDGEEWYPGGDLDPTFRYYPNAPQSGWMTIGSYRLTFGLQARMFVSDNEQGITGPIDRVIFEDYSAQAAPLGSLQFYNIFINWQDWSALAKSDLILPKSQAEFDRLGAPSGAIDWGRGDAANRITFLMNQIVISDVPETSTWITFVVGFILAGAGIRRTAREVQRKNDLEHECARFGRTI